VDVSDEPVREGETVGESRKAMIHRGDVVRDLDDVFVRNARHLVELEQQEIGKRALRA
jgi:hypothetical protein